MVDLARSGRFYVVRRTIDKAAVLDAVVKSIPSAPQLKRWLDWRGDPEVGVAVVQEGSPIRTPRLYNFLAMEEDAVAPLAGFVDAPFFTDIDRRNLKLNLPLNAHLMAAVAETCVAVSLATIAGTATLRHWPSSISWPGCQTNPLPSPRRWRSVPLRCAP